MFLDGITKSLGGSNIRNCHLIASDRSGQVHRGPGLAYGDALLSSPWQWRMAAYEMGYAQACRDHRRAHQRQPGLVLRSFLNEQGFTYILGKGYYAFIHVGEWLQAQGLGGQRAAGPVPGRRARRGGGARGFLLALRRRVDPLLLRHPPRAHPGRSRAPAEGLKRLRRRCRAGARMQ